MKYEPIPGKSHDVGSEEEVLAQVRKVLTDIDIEELEAQQNPILRVVQSITPRAEPKSVSKPQKEVLPDLQEQADLAEVAVTDEQNSLLSRRAPFMFGVTVLALVGCAWIYAV